MKRAAHIHDQVNLVFIPILGALTILGLLGYADTVKVTIAFTWYIVADFTWVLIEPTAVPSLPNVILVHHIVTFVLLCFPLRYPVLGTYTCWDGMCEINTFFLIAKRQWKPTRRLFSFLYWATYMPLRMIMYPVMLVNFWEEMQPYAAWERYTVCLCQLILIGFNIILLSLSIANWRKHRKINSRVERAADNSRATDEKGKMKGLTLKAKAT